ncbi:hypothetical protein O3P69_001825 [Scylla paramamosain]|uniref:Secreted protein n=1 Tax=Scylla paramamosain TaxID=85552 RepID=A0AAW0V3T5_SCYPA
MVVAAAAVVVVGPLRLSTTTSLVPLSFLSVLDTTTTTTTTTRDASRPVSRRCTMTFPEAFPDLQRL